MEMPRQKLEVSNGKALTKSVLETLKLMPDPTLLPDGCKQRYLLVVATANNQSSQVELERRKI